MITSIEQGAEIALQYNKITSDILRLKFLSQQKGNLKVVLDNDYTAVKFDEYSPEIEEELNEINLLGFDDFHGNQDAVVELFEFAGISAEQC
jgi:hypothetical protein